MQINDLKLFKSQDRTKNMEINKIQSDFDKISKIE